MEDLDRRQRKFVDLRSKGVPRRQSAVMAGYSDTEKSGAHVEAGAAVSAELARLREEAAANTGVTKEDVVRGLKAAADMAQMMADPGGMVMAWRELGKLLGFFAPEVRRLEKGISKRELKQAIEDMSDDELRQLARGRVIDGVSKRVEDAEDVPQLQEKRA